MGFFSRNSDEPEEMDAPVQPEPVMQPQQPAPLPPSVDGVLPPGTNPQPAPPAHNLASQVSVTVSDQNALQQTAPVLDDPTANDAGDYIMTDPPAAQPSSDVQNTADSAQVLEATAALAADTPQSAPDYEEIPAPAASQAADPAESTDSHEAFSFTAPEPAAAPEPSVEPEQDVAAPAEIAQPAPEPEPAQSEPAEDAPAEPSAPTPDNGADDAGDLTTIKQQALTQLSSIAQHLDQSPEEKFHTSMMMLQATDDQSLIRTAYEAAQAITDEKTRAQALLDVVNEINYFSQKNS